MNHKILIAKFFIGLITSCMLIILPIGSIAQTTKPSSTVKQNYLSLKDGQILSSKDFKALIPTIEKYFENVHYELTSIGQEWTYYNGNLKVNSDFFNSKKFIIVNGNLMVDGIYYDDYGILIVLGDMQAKNIVTEYAFYVAGHLTVDGMLYASHNETIFEVGKKIKSKVFIDNDRNGNYKKIQSELTLIKDTALDRTLLEAARKLVPEFYVQNDWPAYSPNTKAKADSDDEKIYNIPAAFEVVDFIKNHSQILRSKVAAPAALLKSEIKIASNAATKDQLIKYTANPHLDILVAMLYASRHDLPNAAIVNLIKLKNDAVLQILARNEKLSPAFFNEISALSANATGELLAYHELNNVFIDKLIKHPNPLYRIEVAKYNSLNLKQLETLALDPSLEVRKALLNNQKFETNLKVINANIEVNDESLLTTLIEKNTRLNFSHYQKLASHTNVEIRRALAKNLTDPRLFLRYAKSTNEERLSVLRQLSLDNDVAVKAAALRGLSAKEQEQSLGNIQSIKRTALLKILAPNLKSKKLAHEIIYSNDDDLIYMLSINDYLNEDLQTQIIQVYIQQNANPRQELSDERYRTFLDISDALFNFDRAFPSATQKLSTYCFSHFFPPLICNIHLRNATLPISTLKNFSSIKDQRLKNDMFENIGTQPYATKEDLVLNGFISDTEVDKLIKGIAKYSESKFWFALSESNIKMANTIAAINVHTPIEALKKLEQSSTKNVSLELLKNPNCPIELKKKIILKENHFNPVQDIETDFYMNILNGKIKTKEKLSDYDKENLSTTLMHRYMAKQFY